LPVTESSATARERYQPIIVGRQEELAQLWELALKGRHVIVSGEAGIGKSALLKMLYQGLRAKGDLNVFRVADGRQFKNALLELTEQVHGQGLFRHPALSDTVVRSLPWNKLVPKVRLLTVKLLMESLIASLAGHKAILVWDQFDKATPTELAWLHQFLNVSTVIVGSREPASAKRKPILDRIPVRLEVGELTEAEGLELIDRCLEAAPFAVSNVCWYKKEILRKTRGNPRAIKDLLADHSLEKYVDNRMIRAMATDQGARYLAISWLVLVGALVFSVHRYIGRGLGDRDAYVIGAVGMVVFIFLSILVRKANRAS